MRSLLLLATMALAAACQPATSTSEAPAASTQSAAPAAPEVAKPAAGPPTKPTQAGEYIFASPDLKAFPCGLTLEDNVVPDVPGFHNVEIGEGCTDAYGFLLVLSGWYDLPDGGILLVGAEGSEMGVFTLKDGVYHGVVENDGKPYLLSPESAWSNTK